MSRALAGQGGRLRRFLSTMPIMIAAKTSRRSRYAASGPLFSLSALPVIAFVHLAKYFLQYTRARCNLRGGISQRSTEGPSRP